MTTVSCPKCHDQVSVPSSAPRSARVRCPLCQDEYDLADALAQLPPALIIVSTAVDDEPVLAAVGGMDAATGSHIGLELDHAFGGHLEGGSGKDFSAGLLDSGPSREGMVSAPTPAFRSAPRPKRQERSMVGELVKIVLGGVVGIGLAILILWWAAGVDLGLAPTIAKVSWMKWILPPKFQNAAEKVPDNKEEFNGGLNTDSGDSKEKKPTKPGKLGSDPRFSEALKNSKEAKAGTFTNSEATEKTTPEKDPFDTSDPFAPEPKKSGGTGELKIESPLGTESKPSTKKSKPTEPKPIETTSVEDPFSLPVEKPTTPKSVEPTEPAEEKPADEPKEEKPDLEPKKENPVEKPAQPDATSPQEVPAVNSSLSELIDAASTAAKAFDATDAADKDARKTAVAMFYNAYAGLGSTVGQTNLEDADNAQQLPALRQTLAQAANEPVKLNSIGYFAGKKLDATDGDTGILLAGTVKDLKATGGHFETTLELVRDKRLVTIISAKNPQDSYKIEDQVLILGSMIRNPKENLAGYKGEEAVVVKSGHAMVMPVDK